METNRLQGLLVGVAFSVLLVACADGPQRLPALYHRRDAAQRRIDRILDRMATDRAWWEARTPGEQEYWRRFLRNTRLEERERALEAMAALAEAFAGHDSEETGTRAGERSPGVRATRDGSEGEGP